MATPKKTTAAKPAESNKPIKVRAITLQGEGRVVGYYNNRRIREGELFMIRSEKDFSKKWMERVVGPPAPVVTEKSDADLEAELTAGDADAKTEEESVI